MSRRLVWISCVLASSFGPSAWANENPNPFVEMRAAAEEQADVDPRSAAAYRLAPSSLPPAAASSKRAAAALQEAVRAAVRSEVAREVSQPERKGVGSSGRTASGTSKDKADRDNQGDGKSANGDGRGVSEQARSAARAAQEARRNSDVSKSNNGVGRGNSGKKP